MGSASLFLCPPLLFRNIKKQKLARKTNYTKIRKVRAAADFCRELEHTIMVKKESACVVSGHRHSLAKLH